MLTIERTMPLKNRLIIFTAVFAVGFIGSLSTLRMLLNEPESGQLSSGRSSSLSSAPKTAEQDEPSDGSTGTESAGPHAETPAQAQQTSQFDGNYSFSEQGVAPVSNYSSQPSGTGVSTPGSTVQVSGQMPATEENGGVVTSPTPPVSEPISPIVSPIAPTLTPQSSTEQSTTPEATPTIIDTVTNSVDPVVNDTVNPLLPSL